MSFRLSNHRYGHSYDHIEMLSHEFMFTSRLMVIIFIHICIFPRQVAQALYVNHKPTIPLRTMKTSTSPQPEPCSRIPWVPPPNTTDVKRTVKIGYRPIGGRVAAWTIGLLDELMNRLGNMGIRTDDKGPNPHYHWCVIVGDYYHHAQIKNGLMWYENEEVSWSK